MRDKKVTLITKYKADSTSKTISEEQTDVWAEIKSVKRTEFYEAYTSNLKPRNIIDILPSEYNRATVTNEDGDSFEPTRIIVNGQERNIIRVYTKSDYSMEITVG